MATQTPKEILARIPFQHQDEARAMVGSLPTPFDKLLAVEWFRYLLDTRPKSPEEVWPERIQGFAYREDEKHRYAPYAPAARDFVGVFMQGYERAREIDPDQMDSMIAQKEKNEHG